VKLVAIGIGSVIFGVELLRDVFRVPEFRGADLWLVDVNGEALGRMTRLAGRLNAAAGWDVAVRSTLDRGEALPDADLVVTSVAIDRIATWRADHALALSHGFASVLSENGGPGGLSHTLRSVPLILDIGRDVERLAPRALLFNYTNPENRVCLALRRHTSVPVIGLCHSVAEAIGRATRSRSMPPASTTSRGSSRFATLVTAVIS
jgi:alpha-galactosidase